ncbi:MAG: Ni-sirohydrochlorin a,c-diamide reductive cyclase catalytic subunit [Candidatus Methanomethyliaceae archaeon]|nr:Ni-sirohydrochlorin a,c-diamide reductive cyclase catalytic subunit [Candidatus Methanomethyliaceae archaeon]MDW7970409.1 Ni-sirohydrochlorin a,c-diamide reductive cyclase catalytic subunit [Nitrososphaerota archaeon]
MSLIIHPRPSPIAAAMYMMRDLNVDVIVIHGPSGCCFGPARLLEKDGVKIFTTALSDREFIFGGERRLIEVLKKIDAIFNPKLIGVVGSCASMIIGENLKKAAEEAGVIEKALCCNIHSGYGDNTSGAIEVLKEASNIGLITKEEYERQKKLLEMASILERTRGTARQEYIGNYAGDNPDEVAREILKVLKEGGNIICVLNAKKETAFVYADIMLALAQTSVKFLANIDPNIGLPRIREYSKEILRELKEKGIEISLITGGLDEYPISGERAKEILLEERPDLAIIAGIPHAVAVEGKIRTIAVSAGTRASYNLKSIGYDFVINEENAHRASLGNRRIQKSILGESIRRILKE